MDEIFAADEFRSAAARGPLQHSVAGDQRHAARRGVTRQPFLDENVGVPAGIGEQHANSRDDDLRRPIRGRIAGVEDDRRRLDLGRREFAQQESQEPRAASEQFARP